MINIIINSRFYNIIIYYIYTNWLNNIHFGTHRVDHNVIKL